LCAGVERLRDGRDGFGLIDHLPFGKALDRDVVLPSCTIQGLRSLDAGRLDDDDFIEAGLGHEEINEGAEEVAGTELQDHAVKKF
jgi:hypothetical protein